jgi:hypothetical protein
MQPFLKQLFIIVFSSSLLACAGTPGDDSKEPSYRGDCIHRPSIRGYTVLDERNLIIDAGRRSYHLVLQRRAWGLNRSWGITFASATSRVCAGFDEVVFDQRQDDGSIRIEAIRALTPEEEEHLLIRFGKREPEIDYTPPLQDVQGADVEELDRDDSE